MNGHARLEGPSAALLPVRRVRPRDRRVRQRGMRPAEIGRGRILADLHDAAADAAGAGEMGVERVPVAVPEDVDPRRIGQVATLLVELLLVL